MLRRLLCAVLSAGILLGGAAPVLASESSATVAALDGKKKAKSAKKGKSKKGKKKADKKKSAPKKKAPGKGKKSKKSAKKPKKVG